MIKMVRVSIRRAARSVLAVVLAPAILLTLAGCDFALFGEGADPPVYEITSADGTVEGWMIGTIHALPVGTDWQTSDVERITEDADLLVVEVADFDIREGAVPLVQAVAVTPGLPPLDQRVPASDRPQLAALLDRGGFDADGFGNMETWAAAIMLAQVDAVGEPANGADRALIEAFAGRRVRELEGMRGQLAIFDTLPEAEQRAMLTEVVRESAKAPAEFDRLQRAWLAGDTATIEAATREGILADPDLRAALLTDRNRRWAVAVSALLDQPTRPLIAVGAAHLVGPEGLAALLEAKGYTVRRLP
jgi:hypothetical protein